MKPYSRRAMTHKERVMNYRTSRARRVVENGFGIFAHRWRCLLTTLLLEPDRVIRVVLGCLTLHNWLRKRRPGLQDLNLDHEDEDGNVVPGAWREDVQTTEPNQMVGQRASREGKTLRNYLVDYYQQHPPHDQTLWRHHLTLFRSSSHLPLWPSHLPRPVSVGPLWPSYPLPFELQMQLTPYSVSSSAPSWRRNVGTLPSARLLYTA